MSDLTSGRIPKANGPTIIGDSSISDTGSGVVFDSALRSTYDGVGVIPASQATAGFAITSNYAGYGEVDFWSLVNNEAANQEGFYFYQKTGAGTALNVGVIGASPTSAYLYLFSPADKALNIIVNDTFDGVQLTTNAGSGFDFNSTVRVTAFSISTSTPPASATAAGVQGTIAWDANFIYVCTATNVWKRVAIATW